MMPETGSPDCVRKVPRVRPDLVFKRCDRGCTE
ncbi:MAG: hypothetical protein FAZ92_00348 [Accumulibacter sp.]|nr:MAG: hypothetical protein FAZ92_00348 [Accumulibacter sp.]